MKKTLLTLVLAASAAFGAMAQKIDFDYKKMFQVDIYHFDMNGNGTVEKDEAFEVLDGHKGLFILDYRDFGSAGSILKVRLAVKNEQTGKYVLDISGNMEDVELFRTSEGFAVSDGLGDMAVVVSVKDYTFVSILNPAIFE